jgi:hypothetical protein
MSTTASSSATPTHPGRPSRPGHDEYAPFYAGYVSRVSEDDILAVLADQLTEVPGQFLALGEERAGYRYAPGKWSIKEIVGHLSDAERVFTYRALRFSRGDATPLATFEQDSYVAGAGFDRWTLADLVSEWESLRRASLLLFQHLPPEAWSRSGEASGARVTVRALAFILAGHLRHHLAVLAERYAV